ncbi:hypothetical protein [Fictibacillus barbaricus]|uniref:Uncharacterized protein n=1 Tax=Fictibacillus barbaricus TaxID=182136 RepID=A0ABU1U0K1_9BACL|nr:hypothetical protein [Fictibacillus barbaricus]MDR7072958.1 hypothetical protein [Fictibacillus barbaricus]
MFFTLFMISQGFLLYLIIKPEKPQSEPNIQIPDQYIYIPSVPVLQKEANPHA